MSAFKLSPICLAVFALAGCAQKHRVATASHPSVIDRTVYYSDKQQSEADVVAYFEGWDRLFLAKPPVSDGHSGLAMSRQQFVQKLDELNVGRRFVVVILPKSVQPPAPGLLDEFESFLRGCRFERIAMQQARGVPIPEVGQPILRDTGKTQ